MGNPEGPASGIVEFNLTFNGTVQDFQGCYYFSLPGSPSGDSASLNDLAPIRCTPAMSTAKVRTCSSLMPSPNCGVLFRMVPPKSFEINDPLQDCNLTSDPSGTPTYFCGRGANVNPTNLSMVWTQHTP